MVAMVFCIGTKTCKSIKKYKKGQLCSVIGKMEDISSKKGTVEIIVYSMEGRMVLGKVIQDSKNTEVLDLTGIKPGVYFIDIKSAGHTIREKVILDK